MDMQEKRAEFFRGFRAGHRLAVLYPEMTAEDAVEALNTTVRPNATPAYVGGFDGGFVEGQECPNRLRERGLPETLFVIWQIEESDKGF